MTRVSADIVDSFLQLEGQSESGPVRQLLLRYELHRSSVHSARTKRGLAKASAYGFVAGRPREVSEDTALRIMELNSLGFNVKKIADTLNEAGVASPRGGRWHSPGVKRVIGWMS